VKITFCREQCNRPIFKIRDIFLTEGYLLNMHQPVNRLCVEDGTKRKQATSLSATSFMALPAGAYSQPKHALLKNVTSFVRDLNILF